MAAMLVIDDHVFNLAHLPMFTVSDNSLVIPLNGGEQRLYHDFDLTDAESTHDDVVITATDCAEMVYYLLQRNGAFGAGDMNKTMREVKNIPNPKGV